jgi:hypothetical protein
MLVQPAFNTLDQNIRFTVEKMIGAFDFDL